MKNQKIKLHKLDSQDLDALNEAAAEYGTYLMAQVIEKKTAQARIHYSVLKCYGYQVFKKLASHHKETGLNLDEYMAFIALDSLHFYLMNTENTLHKAKCYRMIEELDTLLPFTLDSKKFTVHSEL